MSLPQTCTPFHELAVYMRASSKQHEIQAMLSRKPYPLLTKKCFLSLPLLRVESYMWTLLLRFAWGVFVVYNNTTGDTHAPRGGHAAPEVVQAAALRDD